MTLNVDDIYDESKAYKKQQVVQVVNTQDGEVATTTTTTPEDDSIPQNTEGAEFISLAITPKNANNLLKIEVSIIGAHSTTGGNATCTAALFQDSAANAIAAACGYMGGNDTDIITFTHYMTAGTTSATTFKVRAGANTGTITFNGYGGGRRWGGALALSITITEYQPSS